MKLFIKNVSQAIFLRGKQQKTGGEKKHKGQTSGGTPEKVFSRCD